MRKNEESLQNVLNTIKQTNIYIMEVPKEKERE